MLFYKYVLANPVKLAQEALGALLQFHYYSYSMVRILPPVRSSYIGSRVLSDACNFLHQYAEILSQNVLSNSLGCLNKH